MRGWLIVISLLVSIFSSSISWADICTEKDFNYNPEDPFFLCFATCQAHTPSLSCTGPRIDRICSELCGQAKDDTCTENPINLSNGTKYWSENDFVASGEFPLAIQRYYQSSFNPVDRGFGVNWSAINNLEVSVRRINANGLTVLVGYDAFSVKRQNGDVLQYQWPDTAPTGKTTPDKANTVETLEVQNYGLDGIPQILFLQYPDSSEEVYEFNYSQYASTGTYTAKLLWRINSQGNKLTYVHDANNRLQTITDDTSRQLVFYYDANNRIERIDVPGNQYYRYTYDGIGNLTHVYYPDDTSGNDNDNPFKQYHYENASFPHNLTGITDEEGKRYSTYGYDATGKVAFSELAGGRERIDVVSYGDDTTIRNVFGKDSIYHFQNVSSILDKSNIRRQLIGIDGVATSHCDASNASNTYDANGFKDIVTNNRSFATDFNFDTQGRELRREEGLQNDGGTLASTPESRVTESDWYASGLLEEVRAEGITTHLTYENSRVKTVTETDTTTHTVPYSTNGTTHVTTNTYTYHDAGQDQIASLTTDGPRTDITTDITVTTYDPAGNLLTITTPEGNLTTFADYNDRGQPETITDANNVVTKLTYYPRGWLHTVTVKDPGNNAALDAVTTFDYYRNGLLKKITFADTSYLHYEYNDAQMSNAIENNLGERIEFGLDIQGNRTGETIKGSDTSIQFSLTRAFDELSRVMDITDSATDSTHLTYDVNDNTKDILSPKGFLTTKNYDALDRIKNIIQPAVAAGTGQVDFGYDAQDRITSVKDQKLLDTTYVYDGFGNLIQQTSPDTGTTIFYYDKAGNMTQRIDARSVVTNFTYDAENRLLTVEYPADSSENVTYIYDDITLGNYQLGRLSRIIAGDNSIAYTYDHRGNIVQEAHIQNGIVFVLGYHYNLMNQVTEIDYPNGLVVEYGYDTLGRVDTVTGTYNSFTQTLASNFAYKPFGPTRQFTYGNGLTRTLTYNLDYELTGISIPGIQSLSYVYDANGNVDYQTNSINTSLSQDLGYDPLDRLDSASGTYGTLDYGYDLAGNRTSETANSVQDTYLYPPDSHHLGSISGGQAASFGYDTIGNIVSRDSDSFVYNLANRMRQSTVNGLVADYRYNPLGERIYKTSAQSTYRYLYSNRQLLVETDSQGNTLKNYVYVNGQRLAIQATSVGNDGFSSAFVVSGNGGSYSANTQGLSAESGEPTHAGSTPKHSAWFAFTPTVNGVYLIDTSGSDFDTVLAVYTGNAINNLVSVASNDNAPSATTSQVYVDLKKDMTYYIAVDGNNGAAGLAQLNLTFIPDTAGDNDIPFLPPWALLLLGSAIFGMKGRLERKAAKLMTLGALLLSPLAIDYADTAHADPVPQPVGTVSSWYYLHGDHLDTPQVITDASQAVVWEAHYTPFGKATVVNQQIENNLRFTGQYYDSETGLHYNLMRYYEPALGRYLQSDLIGLAGGSSTYTYVSGNPFAYSDSLGLSTDPDPTVGVGFAPWLVGTWVHTIFSGYVTSLGYEANNAFYGLFDQLRPDVFDPLNKQVWELKPQSCLAGPGRTAALAQLATYLTVANSKNPGWTPGIGSRLLPRPFSTFATYNGTEYFITFYAVPGDPSGIVYYDLQKFKGLLDRVSESVQCGCE